MRHIPVFLLLLALLLSGCTPDGEPPPGTGGECNNNGVCDLASESCQSCPSDCSCCHALTVGFNNGVTDPKAALGKPDNRYCQLAASSVIGVAMGQGIQNQVGDDFYLVGEVPANASGGATVQVKDGLPWAGGTWHTVGIWSPGATGKTGFDVGHVPFSGPSFAEIRVQVTPGATAKLDAIEAINCKKQ